MVISRFSGISLNSVGRGITSSPALLSTEMRRAMERSSKVLAFFILTPFTYSWRKSIGLPFILGVGAVHMFCCAISGSMSTMPALFHPLISAPPLMTGLSPSAASIIVGEYGFPESSCVKVMVLSRLYVPPFSMIWISPTGESFCLNFLACASAFPIVAKGFSSVPCEVSLPSGAT